MVEGWVTDCFTGNTSHMAPVWGQTEPPYDRQSFQAVGRWERLAERQRRTEEGLRPGMAEEQGVKEMVSTHKGPFMLLTHPGLSRKDTKRWKHEPEAGRDGRRNEPMIEAAGFPVVRNFLYPRNTWKSSILTIKRVWKGVFMCLIHWFMPSWSDRLKLSVIKRWKIINQANIYLWIKCSPIFY